MADSTETPNYYAVLTADVRYDKSLSASAKLLYAEITALCNKTGICWAGNNYFAGLYGVSTDSVSRWIKELVTAGYIVSEISTKEGNKRRLKLSAKIRGVSAKMPIAIRKNAEHNTITNKSIPKGIDISGLEGKKKELLSLVNKTTGRSFRVLPEKGVKKLLDTFTLGEIEKALGALCADEWHRERLKDFSIDYLTRATVINKFLNSQPAVDPRSYQ